LRKRSNSNHKRAKIPSPQAPFLFARLLSGFARFFWAGWLQIKKGGWWDKN